MADTTTTVAEGPIRAAVWPAIVGALFDERDGPLPGLLMALTVLAGIVDATSILALGGVFVATMTGNVVFIGLAIAGVHGFALGTIAIAFGGFAIGSLVGVRAYRAAGPHRGAALRNVIGVKGVLAGCVVIVAIATGGNFSVGIRDLVVALISMSMGAQLAAIRNLKIVDLPTVAVTLTMTGLITERGSGRAAIALRRLGAVAAFFTGALAGALLAHFVSLQASLALGLVIIICVGFGANRVASAEAGWTRPQAPPANVAPAGGAGATSADGVAGANGTTADEPNVDQLSLFSA